jgi:hypothetical protein
VGTKELDPLRACVKIADCCDQSFACTLTCVKSLATMFESVVPPYPNDSRESFLIVLVRMIRMSCIIKSLNQINLIIKFKSLNLTPSESVARLQTHSLN